MYTGTHLIVRPFFDTALGSVWDPLVTFRVDAPSSAAAYCVKTQYLNARRLLRSSE